MRRTPQRKKTEALSNNGGLTEVATLVVVVRKGFCALSVKEKVGKKLLLGLF